MSYFNKLSTKQLLELSKQAHKYAKKQKDNPFSIATIVENMLIETLNSRKTR